MAETVGVLLAAGAGSRMGKPKALVEDRRGVPWVVSSSRALTLGGCSQTVVVIGAAAGEVRALLEKQQVTIIEATDWQDGMGSSLRAGLSALETNDADAALLHLVDLPDVGPDVVHRLLALAATDVLARATYKGRPGHPVLIGREHWQAIVDETDGDTGARAYLDRHTVLAVDCSDLATGLDVDDARSMLGK